jgi:hypothetical protein
MSATIHWNCALIFVMAKDGGLADLSYAASPCMHILQVPKLPRPSAGADGCPPNPSNGFRRWGLLFRRRTSMNAILLKLGWPFFESLSEDR